ncbi:hypothetical protein BXU08_07015 [Sphingomonas sp. LM7]|nr:hypothetical protein BXU08_07015 [Sphingomonas sp. LM7]
MTAISAIEPMAAALAAQFGSTEDHAATAAACDGLSRSGQPLSIGCDAATAFHHVVIAASGNIFYRGIGDAVGAAHRVLARHTVSAAPAGLIRYPRAVTGAIEMRTPERASGDVSWSGCSNRSRGGRPRRDQSRAGDLSI